MKINWFRRKAGEIGRNAHQKQIEEYIGELAKLTDSEIAQTVALSAVIRRQLLKKDPSFNKLLDDGYSCDRKRLGHNTLVLGNLAKQMKKANRIADLAGLIVWLQTFRCLAHPEMLDHGKEMWGHLKRGIDSIEEGFAILHHEGLFSLPVIEEIRKYVDYIPSVYDAE